ncbi:MAG: hypothetical protein IPP33_18500 [Flavobacteriales bacterium]|nr:hypothetical protein [Flavobacteriales bacterium]
MDEHHLLLIHEAKGLGVIDTRDGSSTELFTGSVADLPSRQFIAAGIHPDGAIHAVSRNDGVVVLRYSNDSLKVIAIHPEPAAMSEFHDARADALGKTWIAATAGLVRFDGSDSSFRLFTMTDGSALPVVSEILPGQGKYLLAKCMDMVRFDPADLGKHDPAPGLYIRSVAVNGAIMSDTLFAEGIGAPRLEHDQNAVTITYAPIALLHAEAVQYEVMLKERCPVDPLNGTERTVRSPGDYLPANTIYWSASLVGERMVRTRISRSPLSLHSGKRHCSWCS